MTTETIDVRPAIAADAAVLARLHHACFEPAWSAAEIAAHLVPPLAVAFLAVTSTEPVGFLLAREVAGEAEILSLAVLPQVRKRGIAARLLAAHEAAAAARGASEIFLEVAADNAAAMATYRKAGFREHGRRLGYYRAAGSSNRVDALVLRKAISS